MSPLLVKKEIDRTRAVSVYTTLISVLGLIVIVYTFTQFPEDRFGIILFACLAGMTELFSVELFPSSRSRVSISNIIAVASFLLFGPLAGVITQLLVGIMTTITTTWLQKELPRKGRAGWIRRATFNIGMLVIAIAAGGWVYFWTGGVNGSLLFVQNIVPLTLGVAINVIVNVILLMGVISVQTGQQLMSIWDRDFRWVIPIGVLGGVIGGGALATAYEMYGYLGAAVFFLPIFLINYSYRLYIANAKESVTKLEEMNQTLEEANLGLLEALGRIIDAYDVFTYGHSARVAIFARILARKMGLSVDEQHDIMRAALIHDIGKVGIKERILSKTGPLTGEERSIINHHPDIGANIISQMKGLHKLIPLVRHHHERWDGRGYPDGLTGREIPLGARILAAADALEVMGSNRPYRKMLTPEDAKTEMLRCSGTQFDPEVVKVYLKILHEEGDNYFNESGRTLSGMTTPDMVWQAESMLKSLKK